MRNSEAITVWCDESSVEISGVKYHVIGTLITNSDKEELDFLGELIKARKKIGAWGTLHGCELKETDILSMKLMEEWIRVFQGNSNVYFHIFVYKENQAFMAMGFEKYFAKQAAFGLGLKLKKRGCSINTIFSKVGTVTFLFDKRRDSDNGITSDYKEEIKEQLRNRSNRSSDLTVKFSFVSSECFNAMQLSDVLLYMVKLRIDKENGVLLSDRQKKKLKVLEDYFFNENIQRLQDYEYDEKFNYFFSAAGVTIH